MKSVATALGITPTQFYAAPSAALSAAVVATAHSSAVAVPTGTAKIGAASVGFNSVVNDVLNWMGLGALGNGVPLPTPSLNEVAGSLWLAVRPTQFSQANQRATATPTDSALPLTTPAETLDLTTTDGTVAGVMPLEGAVTALAAAVNDITSSVANAIHLVGNAGELVAAAQDDTANNADVTSDLIDTSVGAPPTAKLYDVAAPAAAAAASAAAAAAPAAAATPDNTLFLATLQRAINRLMSWPGTPQNFVALTNYQIDQSLDAADDQLEAIVTSAPVGSPARWLPVSSA